MSERQKRILMWTGYGLFGLLMTFFFVYETFPLEVLQERAMKIVAQSSGQAPFKLAFGRASPYLLSGLDLEDVSVTLSDNGPPRPGGDPNAKVEGPVTLRIDRIRARLQLWPLLKKTYAVSFDVELNDGRLKGEVRLGQHETGLVLVASDLDLSHPPILQKLTGVQAAGMLGASIDVTFADDVKKSSGSGSLELKKGSTSEVTVMGFTVPPVDLGNLSGGFEVKDGVLSFKNFSQKGGDLEAKVTGDIQLRQPPPGSSLNLGLQFKLADGFLQKNPKFKTIVQISGLERTRTADGYYTAKLTGTLANPLPSL